VQTDAARAELKGPVKDVATSFRGEGADPDERRVGVAHYDRQGWLIEDEQFTPDYVKKRTPRRVDPNTTHFESAMGASTERNQFDAAGNATQTEVRYGDKTTGPPDEITRAAYDAQGRRVEQQFVDPDGKVSGASTYKRDPAGNVVQEDEWLNDPKGPHAISTYTYTFDAHGNWTERHEKRTGVPDDNYDYGPVGTLVRTITYYER
jgi:YD repeat-containing protein